MINLKQLIPALLSLGISAERISNAIEQLNALLNELDEVEVKGRQNIDTLLGCMMAIDAIVGNQREGEVNG